MCQKKNKKKGDFSLLLMLVQFFRGCELVLFLTALIHVQVNENFGDGWMEFQFFYFLNNLSLKENQGLWRAILSIKSPVFKRKEKPPQHHTIQIGNQCKNMNLYIKIPLKVFG